MLAHSSTMWYPPTQAKRPRCAERYCSSPPTPILLLLSLLSLSSLPFILFHAVTTPSSPLYSPSLFSSSSASSTLLAPLLTRRTSIGNAPPPPPPLKIVTLAFNFSVEHQLIAHNCALLSRSQHHYEIHTDDLSRDYCNKCTCVRFEPTRCRCHLPGKDNCGLCEKLHFLVRTIRANPEFLFLDSDLFIVRPDLGDLVRRRAADFDFLAMYDDWGGPCKHSYTTSFNTGLMFIRRLPGLDYALLPDMMRAMRTNDDQATISRFIMSHYDRWDSLSLRWHCRFIWKKEKNIPPAHCYTFHDRAADGLRALKTFLHDINRTLLQSGDVSPQQLAPWFAPGPAGGVLRGSGAASLPAA